MNVFLPSLPGMARHFEAEYASRPARRVPLSRRNGRAAALHRSRFGPLRPPPGAARLPDGLPCRHPCRALRPDDRGPAGLPAPAGLLGGRHGAVAGDRPRHGRTPDQAASRIGYITMGMALVPMIGPIIGGFLDEVYGWQLDLPPDARLRRRRLRHHVLRPRRDQPAPVRLALRPVPHLSGTDRLASLLGLHAHRRLHVRRFLRLSRRRALCGERDPRHLSPSQYGFYFGIVSVGYMLGNFLSGRLSSRIGINRMMLTGNLVAVAGMVIALLLFGAGYDHALSLFGPAFFVGVGNGMTLPNANAGIVSVARISPARRPASAARCRSAAAQRFPWSPARCWAPRPALTRCSGSCCVFIGSPPSLSTLMVMRSSRARGRVPMSAGPVAAVVLAGGRATRMGGGDKAMTFSGRAPSPLAPSSSALRRRSDRWRSMPTAIRRASARSACRSSPTRCPDFAGPWPASIAGHRMGELARPMPQLSPASPSTRPFFPGRPRRSPGTGRRTSARIAWPLGRSASPGVRALWPSRPSGRTWSAFLARDGDPQGHGISRRALGFEGSTSRLDADFDPFFNVNTPDDLAEAERMLGRDST